MEPKGKVAIITGASSGIGLSTARMLHQQGSTVVLVSRSKDKLLTIAKEMPGSYVIPCDMTKSSRIKSMIKKAMKRFGRIDILVNNAGQGYDSPVEKIDIKTFRYIFDLDVVGPLVAMEAVIPIMRAQGCGAIVNVSSGTALAFWPNMAPYSSLKRALASISLTAKGELSKDRISVSVVYPYATQTNFEKNTIKNDVPKWEGELPHPLDTPDFVAGKIVEAIRSGEPEILAHEWMKEFGKI